MTPFLTLQTFMAMVAVILLLRLKLRHDQVIRKRADFLGKHADQIAIRKSAVACETFVTGQRTSDFRFRSCELFFLADSMIIVGYIPVFGWRLYINFLELRHGQVIGNGQIKNLNLNSFGKHVYIEFGKIGLLDINVEIRLKDLTNEEKTAIHIQ